MIMIAMEGKIYLLFLSTTMASCSIEMNLCRSIDFYIGRKSDKTPITAVVLILIFLQAVFSCGFQWYRWRWWHGYSRSTVFCAGSFAYYKIWAWNNTVFVIRSINICWRQMLGKICFAWWGLIRRLLWVHGILPVQWAIQLLPNF